MSVKANDEVGVTSYGSVTLGRQNVELVGLTGRVGPTSTSSETITTHDRSRGTFKREHYDYISYRLENDDGWGIDVDSAEQKDAGANEGDIVTGFWCKRKGKDGYRLAYFNHETGVLGLVKDMRNIEAGPAGHAYLMILALGFGVVAFVDLVDDQPGVWPIHLAVVFGIFYWIHLRRKKLLGLLDTAVKRVRAEVPGVKKSGD